MVKSALLGRYRIQEFIQFMSNTLMIVKQHGAEKLKIKALYLALLQHFESLQQAYKQDNNNEFTAQLNHLDARRDQAVICLRMVCDGYTHHHDKKRREAAEEVIACIDKYGYKLYSLNYGAETAALKNLAHDLQTDPVCMDAIQELQLKDVVNEMKNANVQFEKLFIERLSALSQEVIKSAKERIKSTTEAYRTLVQHVDAHATLAPSEAYDAFTSHLNENIEHFNQVVERRKNGQEAEVDEAVSGGQEEVTAE